MVAALKVGSVVAPKGNGENSFGRILKNSAARFRVTSVNGAQFDGVVVRPGGMWRPGGRMTGLDVDAFAVTNDIADRPVAKRVRSIMEHVADDAAFDIMHASYLHAMSRA